MIEQFPIVEWQHRPALAFPRTSTGIVFIGRMCAGKTAAAQAIMRCDPQGEKVAWGDALKIETFDALACRSKAQYDTWLALAQEPKTPEDQDRKQRAYRGFHAVDTSNIRDIDKDDYRAKIAWVDANKQVLRPFLQWYATEYRRHRDPNYWTTRGQDLIKSIRTQNPKARILNDDTRFPNELAPLLAVGLIAVKLLVADDVQEHRAIARDGAFDPLSRQHASETLLATAPTHASFDNNGNDLATYSAEMTNFYKNL